MLFFDITIPGGKDTNKQYAGDRAGNNAMACHFRGGRTKRIAKKPRLGQHQTIFHFI